MKKYIHKYKSNPSKFQYHTLTERETVYIGLFISTDNDPAKAGVLIYSKRRRWTNSRSKPPF